MKYECSCCGKEISQQECRELDGQILCQACWEKNTVICDVCGRYTHRQETLRDGIIDICRQCYERDYTTCARCGSLVNLNDVHCHDAEILCHACWSASHNGSGVNDYCYKPAPIFYGGPGRYLGVELEVDDGGERDDNADYIADVANRWDKFRLYCKHDGSLEDGFELVSHPMTLQYHMETMPWRKVLEKAQSLGYLSHRTDTCGLHIHVDRRSFGETVQEQDACIARVLYFFEKNWEELLQFSRRSRIQLERWAARYGYKEQPREILDHAKKGYTGRRYTCVNLQNEDTIEFRIFRGTLKYNTFIATLQLVDRVCEVALHLSDEEMRQMTWSVFSAGCTAPELVQYLKERRLYVNEPVESEVEV